MDIVPLIQTYGSDHTSIFTIVLVSVLLYCVYLYFFKYYGVVMNGDYDTKLKKIGKTIPPYPNGWYIVCKSKEIAPGQSKAIDQSGHNVTVFRNKQGKLFALHSYCAHLGANLGIGGKVVGQNCIQCPFHGWLYNGESGVCVGKYVLIVDYDNKPVKMLNVEYNEDMGSRECKQVQWKHGKEGEAKLRKYTVKEIHGFIYLWLHADENQQPQFEFLNITGLQSQLSNRGYTKHTIRSHVQDIPENGADAYHFKYVHKQIITGFNWVQFLWVPDWKAGNDPNLPAIFQHKSKDIRDFKQSIYNNLVKDHKNKQYLSFANIDNYVLLPVIGKLFIFNLTVVQMGPGLVYVFLKTHFFTVILMQYVQTKEPFKQVLYHEIYSSKWLPYWLTAVMIKAEAIQVYNDLLVWDAKRFGHNIYYRKNCDADQFILKWRAWFSKYYRGCSPIETDHRKCDW